MMFEYLYLRSSHSDQESINQLAQKLESAGHKVWLGQHAGSDPQQQRQAEFAIERSDAFILGLSPETLEATESMRELTLAQEAGKPIFLVQLRPVVLPVDVATKLSGLPLVDMSEEFETGLEELLGLLSAKRGGAAQAETSGLLFGGEYYGEMPALPGEEELWSEAGYYWFKNWKTLVRVLVIQSGRRLIFFWDSRDIWKWKSREADELEEAFPLAIPLDQITAVGAVYRPKSFLVFSVAKPYVEIQSTGNQRHRFSLQDDFEEHIDTLRETIPGNP